MRGCTERFSVTESLTAFRLLFLIRGKPVHVSPGRQCPAEGIDLFSRVVGLYKKKKYEALDACCMDITQLGLLSLRRTLLSLLLLTH